MLVKPSSAVDSPIREWRRSYSVRIQDEHIFLSWMSEENTHYDKREPTLVLDNT